MRRTERHTVVVDDLASFVWLRRHPVQQMAFLLLEH